MSPVPGRFITLEGGEGAGKSTQINLLRAFLEQKSIPVKTTFEPGGGDKQGPIRQLLVTGDPGRWDAMTEAFLFAADRRNHMVKTVRPALDEGRWVLCDRFGDSTMAYQAYAGGLTRETVSTLQHMATDGRAPDLTLILDLPVETGLERALGRDHDGQDRFERKSYAFHERLRAGFLDIARREPERCAVIDATRDIDSVAEAIRRTVQDRLLGGL